MKDRRLLVSGGAGFIGSEFVRQGIKRGYKIIVVDKLTYAGDLKRLEEVSKKYKFYRVDICNKNKVEEIFKREKPKILVNFAAETHVDRSIIDANPFVETNIKGTQVLLDLARKYKIKKFIQISCYDKKTRAFTKEGLKSFDQLKEGDIVFTLNEKTKEIEEQKVEKVIIQDYEGEMIKLDNKKIDMLVTPNHRMYNDKMEVCEARQIKKRFKFPTFGGFIGNKDYSKELMYLIGIFLGDGFIAYQEKKVKNKSGLSREEFIKRRDDKGRWLSGKTGNIKETICKSWRIFLDIPEKDKAREKAERILKKLGINFTKQKGKSGEHLYFTSEKWVKFFSQFGKGAKNKFIPEQFLKQDSELLKELFNGLIDADGYWGKTGQIIFNTASEKLKDTICEVAIKIGMLPQVRKIYNESIFKKENRTIKGWCYQISFSKRNKTINTYQKGKIEKIKYKGKIWCIKVKNKNFLVERNGKFVFSGNTDEVYGEIRKGKFSESSSLKPNSPYSASKASADLLIKAYIRTYNFPAIIVRPCNNYGPWQYPEKLIPLTILKALRNEKIPVYGEGQNIREWLYVSDCLRAIFLVLKKGRIGKIYNIGSGQEVKNIDIVKRILKILGKPKSLIKFVQDRPGHDYRYSLNSSKVKKLGWKIEVDIEEGLKKTVDWYKENQGWWKKLKWKAKGLF